MPHSSPPESLAERLARYGHEHLAKWWDQLDSEQRRSLTEQIERVDFELVQRLFTAERAAAESAEESPAQKARRAKPPADMIRQPVTAAEREAWNAAGMLGEAALRGGKVGVILVAGGQGTRLDFPHPKGMFPIGPVSGKTLFQLLAEQVLARGRRAHSVIPYFIMTSDATHDETIAFFAERQFFGLNPKDVYFFRQGNMPAISAEDGRILLADRDALSVSPDGHGGVLAALSQSGLLAEMGRRGIEYLFYHQVDNPLVRVCDPVFLGFHQLRSSEVSSKVVAKKSAEEKMGVFVEVDGKTQIIEYSDFPAEVASLRDARGELEFWAGSTAIHLFDRAFLDRLVRENLDLPFHRARKKVPHLDERGALVKPNAENAIKFERFIFDVLPLAARTLVLETGRETEFIPLKNKEGEFSPADVQRGLCELFRSWLQFAGIPCAPEIPVEVSPLFAIDREELAAKIGQNLDTSKPLLLEAADH